MSAVFNTNRNAFHEHVQPEIWDASKFTKVRTIRDAIHGKVELHRWHQDGQQDRRVVMKCMDNHKVNNNRGKEANDKQVHFSPNRFTAPHLEDALTEIGIFAYLSQQRDRSPFVLKMLGVFTDQRQTKLLTEEADGGELFDVVANHGPVGEERAAQYVSQMLLALRFLQKHSIGHRDVSLENVLLQDGEVRLMDFGNAVQSHSTDGTPLRFFTMAGKKSYRAPEAHVPAHGTMRARVDVPLVCEGATTLTRKDHGPGVQFLKLRGLQYLCEVKVPDEAKPGSSCDADLMGYTVPPVDVFACGVCLFILCLGFPPWGNAMLSDPHFAHFFRQGDKGVPDTLQRYSKAPLTANLEQLLVGMLRADPSLRPDVEECLSSSWIQKVAAEYEESGDAIMNDDACDFVDEDALAHGVLVDFVGSKVEEIVASIVNPVDVWSAPEGEVVADLLRNALDHFTIENQMQCGAPPAPRAHLRAISCAGG